MLEDTQEIKPSEEVLVAERQREERNLILWRLRDWLVACRVCFAASMSQLVSDNSLDNWP
jgi:hypothetical protein